MLDNVFLKTGQALAMGSPTAQRDVLERVLQCRSAPGGGLLAPRRIPHVWAHADEGRGRILITFAPAGQMEAFFRIVTQANAMPPQDPALYRAYGMELLGPSLPVEPYWSPSEEDGAGAGAPRVLPTVRVCRPIHHTGVVSRHSRRRVAATPISVSPVWTMRS